jgi:hypothetical protein
MTRTVESASMNGGQAKILFKPFQCDVKNSSRYIGDDGLPIAAGLLIVTAQDRAVPAASVKFSELSDSFSAVVLAGI